MRVHPLYIIFSYFCPLDNIGGGGWSVCLFARTVCQGRILKRRPRSGVSLSDTFLTLISSSRKEFNCLLPKEYHWRDVESRGRMTTTCYFKGRSTRHLLSWVLISFYIALALLELVWMVTNVTSWKTCYQLLKHLPIRLAKGSCSDLYLLMALIKLNRSNRKVNLRF